MKNKSFPDRLQQKMMAKNNKALSYISIYEPGEYTFRILQKPNDVNDPAFEQYLIHLNIYFVDYDNYSQFVCIGIGCPLCAYHKEIFESGNADAWRIKATPFFYWRVRDNKDGKVKLMKLSYTAQINLVTEIMNMYRQNINVQDFKNGRDITLTVLKSNDKTHYKFSTLTSHETKPVSDKIIEEVKVLENYRPLDKLFKVYSHKELDFIVKRKSLKELNKNNPPESPKKPSKGDLVNEMTKKLQNSGINPDDITQPSEPDSSIKAESSAEDSDRVKRLRNTKT